MHKKSDREPEPIRNTSTPDTENQNNTEDPEFAKMIEDYKQTRGE